MDGATTRGTTSKGCSKRATTKRAAQHRAALRSNRAPQGVIVIGTSTVATVTPAHTTVMRPVAGPATNVPVPPFRLEATRFRLIEQGPGGKTPSELPRAHPVMTAPPAPLLAPP